MQRWKFLPLTLVLGLVVAACGGTPAGSPAASAEESEAAATPAATDDGGEFAGLTYPEDGAVDCEAEDYTGQFSQIVAVDAQTVEFTLCRPDVAFLSKVAFSAFPINDTEYLESMVPELADDGTSVVEGSIVEVPNGTGPYRFVEWVRGDHITLEANPDWWGGEAQNATSIFRWSEESASRLTELRSATVDGIDNPAPGDFEDIGGDENLQLIERPALNVFYLGFNNTVEPFNDVRVRQAIAMGIDRQRIIENFYPAGSEAASHFTPCAIPFGCTGDEWYGFDAEAARALLADAGFPDGFETQLHLRAEPRGYLPEPEVIATEIQAQLSENLGITAEIDVQESATFIDNADAGNLPGIHMLGWGADYPDITNFLDYHFGAGASAQFGDKFDDITGPLNEGASTADEAEREAAYEEANNAIRENVPMVPIAHGGSATAWLADVDQAHSSPLTQEEFHVMTAGDRDQLVFMQNGEPPGLYCPDETDGEALRVCEQIMDSLYQYEVGGLAVEPALAEECAPNDDLTVWTCTLREGVAFHDGSTLDANDVVLSYAVQWDAAHPLHVGRDNSFTYFSALFGGFLNPPPPAEE